MRPMLLREQKVSCDSFINPRFIKEIPLILAASVLILFWGVTPALADSIFNECGSRYQLALSDQCRHSTFYDIAPSYLSDSGTANIVATHNDSRQDGKFLAYSLQGDDTFAAAGSLPRVMAQVSGSYMEDIPWKDDISSHDIDSNGDRDSEDDPGPNYDTGDERDTPRSGVPIPEPANVVLVAIGLGALAVVRRESWFSSSRQA
ncbi:MAG TPA: PEP-CTERM sorting domain-containing protein [Candidatus Dormibacteraeota bacterium]|nr:PEP-CTERM sorting domain-containing protein [Candidatus Dormibacteraeota bacterium]